MFMTVLVVMRHGVSGAGKQRKQGDVVASHVFVMRMDVYAYMVD